MPLINPVAFCLRLTVAKYHHYTPFYYRPQTKFAKVMFLPAATKLGQGNIFTSVCQEFCPRGGGCLPQCMLGYTPPPGSRPPWTRQTPLLPPGADTHPQGADTPQTRQTPPRSRHPPPGSRHPPDQADPPREQTQAYSLRAAGTHPTGMHSCYRCLSVHRGGVHGCWGACMVAGGHVWLWGACVAAGWHVWLPGGMHGCWGACMVVGGHAFLWGHAWLWGGGRVWDTMRYGQ